MYNYDINEILADLTSSRKKKIILDTDAYNEIDDQVAISYAVLSQDRFDILGISAAPFHNYRSTGPGDGMIKSYEEIKKVVKLADKNCNIPVLMGSQNFLHDENIPEESEAADFIIEQALKSDERIYVIAIGAITNVASALLKCPAIKEKVVVVWDGTHAEHTGEITEFNMQQDPKAARSVFDSEAPVVLLPVLGCISETHATREEFAENMPGKNKLCDYLYDIMIEYHADTPVECGICICDIACIAACGFPGSTQFEICTSPVLLPDMRRDYRPDRHPMIRAVKLDGKAIYADLFQRLAKAE